MRSHDRRTENAGPQRRRAGPRPRSRAGGDVSHGRGDRRAALVGLAGRPGGHQPAGDPAHVRGVPVQRPPGPHDAQLLAAGRPGPQRLRDRVLHALAQALRTGAPGGEELRVVWADGSEHHHAVRWRVTTDEAGRRTLVGIVRDVGHEHHALEQTRFLAEVSAAVDRSLDLDRTLEAVSDLCVRRIADWCLVDVPDPVEGIRNVAVSHADPGKVALAQAMRLRYPPDPSGTSVVDEMMST